LITRLIPAEQELLIDAYCGAGFFVKRLLEKFERIIGIDWTNSRLLPRWKMLPRRKPMLSETWMLNLSVFYKLMVSEALCQPQNAVELRATRRPLQSLPILRPQVSPRRTRRAIADLAPGTFIYISCNPATLARDLAELQQSFTIDSVTPLDMFPQTAEIEVVVHLFMRKQEGLFLQGAG